MKMSKFIDLTGQKFNYLTVTKLVSKATSKVKPQRKTMWECLCDCGTTTVVNAGSLKAGSIQSCGCMKAKTISGIKRKHGGTGTKTYKNWCAMMSRCHNPNDHNYYRYGGAGIKVCDRWHDYLTFLADMGDRPTPKHSIDRIENSRGYEPGNVRWATPTEQARNKRDNVPLTAFGITLLAPEWEDLTGIGAAALRLRVSRGMPVEDAIRMKPRSILRTLTPLASLPYFDKLVQAGLWIEA